MIGWLVFLPCKMVGWLVFLPVSCVFLLHMGHGMGNNHFANLAEVLKTSGNGW